MILVVGNAHEMALKFISYLTMKHPVDKAITCVFEETPFITYRGHRYNGLQSTTAKGVVKIQVAAINPHPAYGIRAHLRTLAHEYCHVLQEYRDGLRYKGAWDRTLELAAEKFATAEVNAALEEGIIVT